MPTVQKLSYAGVTLPLPTPRLQGWLAMVQNPYDFEDVRYWNFDSPRAASIPYRAIPTPPEFKLNTLFWPTGASRPAFFHCVVEESRLDAIKTALGSTNTAAPLYLFDSRTGKTVTAPMRLLPERPVNVSVGDSDERCYLLTLTDQRLFWYGRRGVVEPPNSWSNLYSQIAALLEISISAEAVSSAYDTPSPKWASSHPSLPALLDAVAAQVGQRVVVSLDGSVRTVGWETASTTSDAYFESADAPVSGGRTPVAGISRTVPFSVKSVFASAASGVLSPDPYTLDTPLGTLGIAPYAGASGVLGDVETIFADAAYTGDNVAVLQTMAEQIARDFYGWQLATADVAWPGIEPFAPTGWEDFIEWAFTLDGGGGPFALTRVRRGPWKEFLGGNESAGYPPAPGTPGGPPSVTVLGACPQYASGFVVTDHYTIDPELTQLVYVHASAQSGPLTVTLFAPSVRSAELAWADRYVVKKVDNTGNVVTVVASGTTVEFASGYPLSGQGDSAVFYHDQAAWYTE